MHSRTEGPREVQGPRARRAAVERALRVLVFGLVLVAVWRVWRAADGNPATVHLEFASAPGPQVRDSLAAHRAAGDSITWSGDVSPVAAMAERVREPSGRWRVAVVGADGAVLRDTLGVVDSLAADETSVTIAPSRGALDAVDRGTRASVRPLASADVGRVVVLGRAGWEAKFVIAALEEEGWGVDARLSLGRDRETVQGDPRPQSGRHSAVVVLDSSAVVPGAELVRFVRGGGGLVLAGVGVRTADAAVASLLPARAGALTPPLDREFEDDDPTRGLPLAALRAVTADAVVLGTRGDANALVVRRVGAGRVAQLGFAETWRWRMQGGARGAAGHRAYWSWLVGSVAGVPVAVDGGEPRADDGAPLARLTQALGAPAPAAAPALPPGPSLPPWLGIVIIGLALAEWGARRARGAV